MTANPPQPHAAQPNSAPTQASAILAGGNLPTHATFACMALVAGFAFALVVLFIALLFTHAARDLRSSPTYHRIWRRLRRAV